MPATTSKGFPYPLTSDSFLPATTDFPALANAIDIKTAREVAAVLSAAAVLDVGVSGQIRAGRELVVADFTTLLGLPTTPVGLWDAGSLTNLGSGGNLTNKGSVPLTAKGLAGTANHAALFAGSTGQALYISDTGAADPFRIKTGSWGCWFRTAKRGVSQDLLSKWGASGSFGWRLDVDSTNVADLWVSSNGTAFTRILGVTDVCDDRWHFAVATFDGSMMRLYVDGALEASAVFATTINGTATAFNIGAEGADGSTAASASFYGRIAVPFVTTDVLEEGQIRLLMAAKIAHGYAVTPTRSHLAVRRKRRGGPLVSGDYSTAPLHLYNFTAGALTDAGSLGNALTNNGGAVSVAGLDGQAAGAFAFASASSQYLSATDSGLPSGTSARTLSALFRTSTAARQSIMAYGTTAVGYVELYLDANGLLTVETQSETLAGPFAADGQSHRVDAVLDPSPADGLKIKLYLDGRLVASGTAFTGGTTLLGVTGFHIGKGRDVTTNYFNGVLDGASVVGYAMAQDEVASLYAKGSVALGASEKNSGDNVEAIDATNVYCLFDDLDLQHSVDLRVAA